MRAIALACVLLRVTPPTEPSWDHRRQRAAAQGGVADQGDISNIRY